jgi:PAS domain S-box-containing protein
MIGSWLDPDGKFLYCSSSCERITGYRAGEFLADSSLLRTILYPDDRATFENHFCEVRLDASTKQEVEFRIVRPDETVRWIGHTCQPVFDDKGCFLGVRGSNRDITERKQAEEALREAKDQLETANIQLQAEITERKRAMREIESLAKFPEENSNPVLRIAADVPSFMQIAAVLRCWSCGVADWARCCQMITEFSS